MNLSLAERPVWSPVRTITEPSWARTPSRRETMRSTSIGVVIVQYSIFRLRSPWFSRLYLLGIPMILLMRKLLWWVIDEQLYLVLEEIEGVSIPPLGQSHLEEIQVKSYPVIASERPPANEAIFKRSDLPVDYEIASAKTASQ